MITVNFYKHNGEYSKVECYGHAGFDDAGKDIICAAVSALVINCSNSLEKFTDDFFDSMTHEDGTTEIILKSPVSHDGVLLLDSLKMGLELISKEYGKKYLKISDKEV